MAYKTRTIKMKIKFIFLTLCLSAMVISCVSLASSDENSLSSSKSDTESPDSGNHSGGGSESSKGTEIRKNVSVAANYADFSWDISVSVSKQSLCPSSEIRYGYMFGYAGFVYLDGKGYYYWRELTDASGSSFSFKESLFAQVDPTPYAEASILWNAYWALRARMEKGEILTSEERDLYKEAVASMQKSEREAKSAYWGLVYVKIDGIKYWAGKFGNADGVPSDLPLF
mgnify:CR=1 FL=1